MPGHIIKRILAAWQIDQSGQSIASDPRLPTPFFQSFHRNLATFDYIMTKGQEAFGKKSS